MPPSSLLLQGRLVTWTAMTVLALALHTGAAYDPARPACRGNTDSQVSAALMYPGPMCHEAMCAVCRWQRRWRGLSLSH